MEENKEELNIETVEITVEEKLKESEDKYLRKCAEFENYKKRVQKEKEELVLNTKTRMLTAVLDMDSDITIALKTIKNKEAKNGVSLIAKKLDTFLKNQGIEAVQTETYDSELHEVISIIDTGKSEIVDVVTKGYTLNGKIFRYPKIVLSK